MNKKTITDIEVRGKRVLVRVDFNVPLDGSVVTDDARIRAALPTIRYLLEQKAAVILCSHLGRPQSSADRQFSMMPVAARLSQLLEQNVHYVGEVVGEMATERARGLFMGEVMLLENTRFEPGEKGNGAELAGRLADLADVYVNDAFGSAHRAHASTAGVARVMRERGNPAGAGFLMQRELEALGAAVANPAHPYVAIMGGAKISDKIKLIDNLLDKADKILIGGGMANTFLKAQGKEIGTSLVEDSALPEAQRLLAMAGERLILPVDFVVAREFSAEALGDIRKDIPAGFMALDVGPATVELFEREMEAAKLVIWNGPMGVFEFDNFAQGTLGLATVLAELVEQGTEVIIGGGDSAAAVRKAGLVDKMSHVSTGGGASLELLEGKDLPGIAALDDK